MSFKQILALLIFFLREFQAFMNAFLCLINFNSQLVLSHKCTFVLSTSPKEF